MSYRILGAPISPFVRKVRVVCAEKDLDYELEPINPFDPPAWFVDANPLKRIPVLAVDTTDGTEYIPDSSVICDYLQQCHPQPTLLPEDALSRARALWLEEYADTDLVSVIGGGIFQPIVLARLFGREPDVDKAKATVADALPPFLDYLESRVAGRDFVIGDALTLADISIASPFVNMQHAGFEVDAGRWPELGRYLGAILARPSFAGCIEGERRMLTG